MIDEVKLQLFIARHDKLEVFYRDFQNLHIEIQVRLLDLEDVKNHDDVESIDSCFNELNHLMHIFVIWIIE